MVTTQVPVPLQPPPDHPANVLPASALADSVTTVPTVYGSLQSPPQAMPAGLDDTVPVPVPFLVTVSVACTVENMAVTAIGLVMVTLQPPVPEQAPPQPRKVAPGLGAAVSVTFVPCAKSSLQSAPQAMPAGVDVTAPAPV
jgi:hypothetical protein